MLLILLLGLIAFPILNYRNRNSLKRTRDLKKNYRQRMKERLYMEKKDDGTTSKKLRNR